MFSYMDDIYPGMNTDDNNIQITVLQIYLYGSVIVGLLILSTFICAKEPLRIYRTIKRKNTDENPVIPL